MPVWGRARPPEKGGTKFVLHQSFRSRGGDPGLVSPTTWALCTGHTFGSRPQPGVFCEDRWVAGCVSFPPALHQHLEPPAQ